MWEQRKLINKFLSVLFFLLSASSSILTVNSFVQIILLNWFFNFIFLFIHLSYSFSSYSSFSSFSFTRCKLNDNSIDDVMLGKWMHPWRQHHVIHVISVSFCLFVLLIPPSVSSLPLFIRFRFSSFSSSSSSSSFSTRHHALSFFSFVS